MTSYFDDIDRELNDALRAWLRRTDPAAEVRFYAEVFDEIEIRMVNDCTFAAESDGFPADLRDAIHKAVLRSGVRTLPNEAEPADFETEREHMDRLHALSADLHSIFHAVAHRDLPNGVTDGPLLWRQLVLNKGEERRTELAELARWGDVRTEAREAGWLRTESPWELAAAPVIWTDPSGTIRVELSVDRGTSRHPGPWFVNDATGTPISDLSFRHEPEALRMFFSKKET